MKKPSLYIGTLVAVVCFMGCQPKKEDRAKLQTAEAIPKTLGFTKPAKGAELTKAQVEEIKKEFSVTSTMILPPNELLFPDKKLSQAEIEQKENELKAKDINSYELLKEIKSNCKKAGPNIKIDASFQTDKQIELDKLVAGDKLEATASMGITGDNCAVDYANGIGVAGQVVEKNEQSKDLSAKASYSVKINALMKNEKYAKLLGSRGMMVDSSISGLAARKVVSSSDSINAILTFKMNGSYYSLKSDIPYSAEVKLLIENSTSKDANNSIEAVANIDLTMKDFKANLVIHQNTKNDILISREVYLNGHLKTEAELNALFGGNMPNPLAQAKRVTQNFN